ncbi:MAG TPA: YihA family ribosome biogenesis GTP-binding protein [Alphaproteobacteria bacterium]|nr:YihA family ribosome biogenesis GTP-binding protein [Alphaproteobacteria bacterium]HAJ48649.1 YihA family ribosome biogenesis GTP-binding protein [Alphaproteobacteria bacterium]
MVAVTQTQEDAPAPFTPEALESGRRLFGLPCTFVTGVASLPQLPAHALPEIAFIGRSNVGKSSLLNAVTGHTALARVSVTPGRTREINFFDLGGKLMLVDLPGYGYAKAPKAMSAQWQKLITAYLRGRAALARICLLIDARHGIKPNDREMMRMLDQAAQSYLVVLTKADKLSVAEQAAATRNASAIAAKHPAAYPLVLLTSSEHGLGIAELRAHLAVLAASAV